MGLQGVAATSRRRATTDGSSRPCPTSCSTATMHRTCCPKQTLARTLGTSVKNGHGSNNEEAAKIAAKSLDSAQRVPTRVHCRHDTRWRWGHSRKLTNDSNGHAHVAAH